MSAGVIRDFGQSSVWLEVPIHPVSGFHQGKDNGTQVGTLTRTVPAPSAPGCSGRPRPLRLRRVRPPSPAWAPPHLPPPPSHPLTCTVLAPSAPGCSGRPVPASKRHGPAQPREHRSCPLAPGCCTWASHGQGLPSQTSHALPRPGGWWP